MKTYIILDLSLSNTCAQRHTYMYLTGENQRQAAEMQAIIIHTTLQNSLDNKLP